MRDIRFDRCKLLAMLGIVFIHGVSYCNAMAQMPYLSLSWWLLLILYTLGFAMTNVFVLVSSQLLISKYRTGKTGINRKRCRNLLLLTSGYSVILYLLMACTGQISFSVLTFIQCIFSVFVNQYWFIGAYLIFYILSPYLFKGLEHLSEKELGSVCAVCLVVFSLLPSVFVFVPAQDFYDPAHGKSVIWFLILFCCVFYWNKFGRQRLISMKAWVLPILSAAAVLLLVCSRVVLRAVSMKLGMEGDGEGRWYFDCSVPVILLSFCLFLLVCRQHRRPSGKFMSFAAGSTLGVFLIHNHPQLRLWIWNLCDSCRPASIGILPWLILCAVVIFLLCLLADSLRRTAAKLLKKS